MSDDRESLVGELGDGGNHASVESDAELVSSLFAQLPDGEMNGGFQTLEIQNGTFKRRAKKGFHRRAAVVAQR